MNPVQIWTVQPFRCVLWDLVPDRYKIFPPDHFTRREGLWCLVPDLEIVYKTAKPGARGTKGNLISFTIISTVFAKVHQLRKTMQADDGEEASQPSLPTAASVSQSCIACAELIPQDWPRRFHYCRWGWPATEEAASTWGETKWTCSVAAHRWNLVRGDDLKVYHTECILVGRRRKNQPIEILKPLQHNVVQMIRSWSIWSSAQDFVHCICTERKVKQFHEICKSDSKNKWLIESGGIQPMWA